MRYRRLGAAGVQVSEVSLGSWLTYGGHVDDRAAEACVHRAYELGVNLFDTADVYRRGDAERVVGRALARYPRSSYVLATKVYFPVGDRPNDRGLSRKHIVESCHASLERLGTDHIDLYQCHRFDADAPLDETLRALDDLVSAGKVLYIGVSEWTAGQLDEARAVGDRLLLDPIVSNQPQYSLLWRRIEEDVIPVSERLGVGQIVWSPLAQGVLSGKYRPGEPTPRDTRAGHPDPQTSQFVRLFMREDILEAVQRLRPIADDLGLTMAQLAIAWVLRQPNVAGAIVGASRPEQLDDNCAASGVELPPDALLRIDEAVSAVLPLQLPAG
ncbi:MAG: aldo/keto reductase [Actinobacteria bacterium]|nr:MAG: aldo/keto reductase [Actinomycetota bacterium]